VVSAYPSLDKRKFLCGWEVIEGGKKVTGFKTLASVWDKGTGELSVFYPV
jgi:hypothetical protein